MNRRVYFLHTSVIFYILPDNKCKNITLGGMVNMLADLYDDFEVDNGEILEIPELKNAHRELIDESIKEQIDDPFDSTANFVDEFFTMVEKQLDKDSDNPDLQEEVTSDARRFCIEVIGMIDDKYNIDADTDTLEQMDFEDLKNLTYGLYDFFIVHYSKNLKKFFIKYIIQNIDTISEALQGYKDTNDVTTNSLKSKLTDERAAIIISRLRTVINYIDDLDIDGSELLGYFNPERYDIYILNVAIEEMTIGDDFVRKFFKTVVDEYEDDHYTEVFLSIQSGLIKKFKKMSID